MLLFQLIAAGN